MPCQTGKRRDALLGTDPERRAGLLSFLLISSTMDVSAREGEAWSGQKEDDGITWAANASDATTPRTSLATAIRRP